MSRQDNLKLTVIESEPNSEKKTQYHNIVAKMQFTDLPDVDTFKTTISHFFASDNHTKTETTE